MDFPSHLKYTKDHEWIDINGKEAKIGVSEYAVEHLGDVVHIELPDEGDLIEVGSSFGTIESTKTVSDIYAPVDCKVLEVNNDIVDSPESLQEDPYDQGWLIKVSINDEVDLTDLFDAEAYENYLSKLDD